MSNKIVRSHFGGGRLIRNYNGSVSLIKGGVSNDGLRHYGSVTSGPPYTQPTNWSQINRKYTVPRINGRAASGWSYKWENVPSKAFSSKGVSIVDDMPTQTAVNKALAKANPSAPIIDLPLFLFELRELANGIRKIGDAILRHRRNGSIARASHNPGDAYLAWKFGWAPLLSDLSTLFSLAESIQKRTKSLERGRYKRKFSGKLPGSSFSKISSERHFVYAESVTVETREDYLVERWFTMGYQLLSDLPTLEDNPKGTYANFMNAGVPMSTLWNAIPWSWLIDYFISISDYLIATQGNLRWSAHDLCIMTKTTCTLSGYQKSYTGSWSVKPKTKPGRGTVVRQVRKVVSSPHAGISIQPFLTSGQTGILAALGASKSSTFLKSL